jgi:hypothetical protein
VRRCAAKKNRRAVRLEVSGRSWSFVPRYAAIVRMMFVVLAPST